MRSVASFNFAMSISLALRCLTISVAASLGVMLSLACAYPSFSFIQSALCERQR